MSAITRRNERSWAISLISDINIALRALSLQIVRAGGETTISTGRRSMFPDVLLYGDAEQTQILQGWELKLPDTPITDAAFIQDAQRKAQSLGLNSCFIWNFSAGVLYVRGEGGEFRIAKQWNDTHYIRTRADVETYKAQWLEVIHRILIDINDYLRTGVIRASELGEMVSDAVVAALIERNKSLVSAELQRAAAADAAVGASIDVWWNEIKDEFVSDESDKYNAYAKVLLLNWANRILFAHLIKHSHNAATGVERLHFETSVAEANAMFESITEACDFYNIFGGLEHNSCLPDSAWHDLMDLNVFLTANGLERIEQSALQTILERTVAVSKREVNGQYTTPAALADLLVRLTTRDWNGAAIDPCCGTGSIPQAVLANKKSRLADFSSCVETTWAADKFAFPLQIATIGMTGSDTMNMPLRIFQQNVFALQEGEIISIVHPADGRRIGLPLPRFKTIVSNLPFVPFEKIGETEKSCIDRIMEDVQRDTGIVLSSRSDCYAFIILGLWHMLEEGGRLGVITSNSWLGTAAGREFFQALSHYYKIEQIHISNAARWFDNAQVVSVITILTKRERIGLPADDEETTFGVWNKSLKELQDNPALGDLLVNSSLLGRELDADVVSLKTYSHAQIRELLHMNVSLSALFHDISWLIDVRGKLVPIREVFEVVRGERRGWDAMFYPPDGHGIEPRYMKKVLKNARAVDSLTAAADHDAFCCSASEEELRNSGHTGALAWIERFRNGVNQTGRPLTEVLARARLRWYEMKDTNAADIVTTMNPDRRLFFAKFEQPSFINQRLIGLKQTGAYPDLALNHALLNSLLGMFYIEAVGFGRGLGALDISSSTVRNALMLHPGLVGDEQRSAILAKFAPLLGRPVHATARELQERDRNEFDREVLAAFGIGEHYEAIKRSLLSMQQMRLRAK